MPTSGHLEDYITGLTEDATPANDDLVMTYDTSGTALKKVQLTNLPAPAASMVGYLGTLIHRVVIGAGGTASIDVSSIAADYDYIEIIMQGKSEAAAVNDTVLIAYNGDTTNTNYRTGFEFDGGAGTDADNRYLAYIGAAGNANGIGEFTARITSYAGSLYKTASSVGMYRQDATVVTVARFGLMWESTAAINQITLTTSSGSDFAEGTLCVIVGYKNFA